MKAGWEVKPLGEVCELVNGKAYKKAELLDQGKYLVLRVGNFFTSDKWFHSDLELEPKKYCHNGDLLYAWSASFGPRIWEGEKTIFHYHIWNVRHPEDQLDRRFLYYYFDWDKEKIKAEQGAGATMIHVSKGSMEKRALPIPPLEEQKRIVAVLDAAFEGLTRARENAKANLQNARELFESFASSVVENSLNEYPIVNLPEVSTNLDRQRVPITKSDRTAGEVPYYGASGVVDHVADHLFDEDLLLVSEDGANLLARTYPIAFSVEGKTWVNNHAHVLRFKKSSQQDFVSLYLNVISLKPYVSGMAQPKLNQKALNTIPIPNIPADICEGLVSKASELRERVEILEGVYRAKLTDISDLRQSLLQKAFAGELT